MIKHFLFTFIAIALVACSGSDTPSTGAADGSGDTPAVNTAAPKAPAAPSAATGAYASPEVKAEVAAEAPAAPAAASLQAVSCLALVRQARLTEALPVCTAALAADPGNAELQAAVEAARAQTAGLAADAAGAQADAAAAAATAGAASDLEGAAADAASKLGQ